MHKNACKENGCKISVIIQRKSINYKGTDSGMGIAAFVAHPERMDSTRLECVLIERSRS